MRFFFYGTLIDPDVRRVVLGERAAAALDLCDAVLPDWERRSVRGVSYPVILPRAGGVVSGILAGGIDAQGRRRLIAYEGAGYALTTLPALLADGGTTTVQVFLPVAGGLKTSDEPWDLARWQREDKPRTLARGLFS